MLRVEVTEKRSISGSDEVRRHVVGGVRGGGEQQKRGRRKGEAPGIKSLSISRVMGTEAEIPGHGHADVSHPNRESGANPTSEV